MAGAQFEMKLRGLDALTAQLEALTPLLRRKYVLKALYKGGEVVKNKSATPGIVPILSAPVYHRGKLYRTPGTLQRAIAVRTSKDARREGNVGVYVNVKPARGSARGANSPTDPFYWRFVEFGTKRMKARPFLRTGARELTGAALTAIEISLAPDLNQLNLPGFDLAR